MRDIRRGFTKIGLHAIPAKTFRRAAFFHAVVTVAILGVFSSLSAQTPIAAGYRDFYFTKSVNSTPTGEKPQSKLWWNDGIWWGSLWDPIPKTHTIHRFNLATQSWTSTGTAIDSRANAKADALWDGQRLYIVSQVFTHNPGPTTPSNGGLLYRYSYNATSTSYSLDAGFPVSVNSSISETLVLAKDSTGKLWVTWTEGGKVKVNRSLGDDLTWGTPFDLPGQGTDTKIDDISSVLAFGGNKIGIMWSNQNDKTTYFAAHHDGNADEVWEPKEQALVDPVLGQISYDHFNLKPSCDNEGNVYAVVRTSLSSSSAPSLYVLKRNVAGVWTRYLAGLVSDGHTRPILLIDGEHRKLYVFAMSDATGSDVIYMKTSDLDNINFASGLGTPFIQSATDTVISNPTSTKQCLNSATGLLVLASDQRTRYYFHNYLDLSGGANNFMLTVNTTGSGNVALNPPGGVYNAGTSVILTAAPASGYQFSGWSGDISGSTNPATITMDANKNVTATFTALPPQYTLTVNTVGSGNVTLNPPGGVYNAGTSVTLTAAPASGYQFSGWSGNLTGSANPATITMDANKNVTATFTAQYTLTVNTVGSGSVTLNPPGGVYNAGTSVTLTAIPQGGTSGYQFSGWSGDLTGSTNPATIAMGANKNVAATFVALPAQYTLTTNVVGSGSLTWNPSGSVFDAGTVVTLTAAPVSGYQFSGWSGDVSGSINPVTLTMDANKNATAAFTALPSSSPIIHQETRTGATLNATFVRTSTSLAGVSGDLYLAAISTRPKVSVLSVSGLGLSWTLVKAKCAGRNTTAIEVWKAQAPPGGGTSSGNDMVTATLASAPQTAVIAVSRYSGVDAAQPIGSVIAGNTNGMNGSGACSGGVDKNTYSFNLNTTTNDARVYGAVAMKARTHAPGSGYTERAEIRELNSASPSGVAVEDKAVTSAGAVTVNGSFGGVVDWAFIGIAIKPQLSAGKRALSEHASAPPAAYQLEPNYPNPFNPETLIGFSLPATVKVTINVYSETGQRVRKLVDGETTAGRHVAPWDGRNQLGSAVAAGVYLYQIVVRRQDGQTVFMQTRRMTLLK